MAETLPEKVGSAVAAAQAEESGSAPATGAAGEDAGLGDQYTEPFPPPPPEVKEMAMEQERERERGIVAVKVMLTLQGQVDEAIREWQLSLKVCFSLACRGPHMGQELIPLELPLHLNLAAAALKTGEAHTAIHHCTRALQLKKRHPKALYRLAKAHLMVNGLLHQLRGQQLPLYFLQQLFLRHLLLQEFQDASEAAELLLQVQPGDPLALSLQQEIARERELHKIQQRKLMRKMMGVSTKSSSSKSNTSNTSSTNSGTPSKEADDPSIKTSSNTSSSSNTGSSSSNTSSTTSSSNADSSNSFIWDIQWRNDDQDSSLWLRPHSLEYLSEECNFPLTRSLPLTLLSALHELQLQQQEQQQKQALPDLKKDTLCLHILGASAHHELSCRFTSILERWPQLKTLIILFVGFTQGAPNPTKFEGKPSLLLLLLRLLLPHLVLLLVLLHRVQPQLLYLVKGELSPPHCVKVDGREQVAVFFKGTYSDLTKKVPGILSNPKCTFFPDIALFSTLGALQGPSNGTQATAEGPDTLSEATVEALRLLIDNNVLTVVTESTMCTAEDVAAYSSVTAARTAAAPPLPPSRGAPVVEQLGGLLLLPPERSRFPLLLELPSAADGARAADFAARNAAAAADAAAAAAERAKGKACPEAVAAAEAAAKKAAADTAAAAAAAELAAAAAADAESKAVKQHVACAKHGSFFAFKGRDPGATGAAGAAMP
ncbi:TPR domain-containing protein, putative [Eimeria necatrix]|uniref:TPR domain-containing protein, putative n=1 Tax=Eimeria necatrix TaxID=51315 RepID=U6MY62_9EIME|nr:TPR domain-containing protein, putative [Eimeria necatrix]CDJ67454.1 TPR domain-containing protein, putative [Eimeria necatrix]